MTNLSVKSLKQLQRNEILQATLYVMWPSGSNQGERKQKATPKFYYVVLDVHLK